MSAHQLLWCLLILCLLVSYEDSRKKMEVDPDDSEPADEGDIEIAYCDQLYGEVWEQ
jgi:hypothetical protein